MLGVGLEQEERAVILQRHLWVGITAREMFSHAQRGRGDPFFRDRLAARAFHHLHLHEN